MIINQTPYPISFEREMSQAITCRYGEEMRQYIFKPDIDVSGLSCLLQIAKPDGTFTENGVEVHTDPDTGECTLVITIPKQATVVKGLAKYSICCYGEVETETHLLYSAEGPLWVDDDLITEEMIESVAEVNGYTFPQDFVTIDMLSEIIPEALPAEYGFYLRASRVTGDPEWAPIDMPYPGYGPSDAGKSLTINADGTGVEWKTTEHIYSTSEHIVGKWIDGSTLYERTFDRHTNPVPMSAYGWHTFAEISEPIYIIDSMGIVVDNGAISANYPIIANYDNGYLYVMHLRNSVTDAMGYVTIRYIKQ